MGHAVDITEYAAARQRPGKVLRKRNRQSSNLSVFAPLQRSPATTSSQSAGAEQSTETQGRLEEYVKLGLQPSDQVAANSDTTTGDTGLNDTASRGQLAIATVSCLALGAVIGYHWAFSVTNNHFYSSAPEPVTGASTNAQKSVRPAIANTDEATPIQRTLIVEASENPQPSGSATRSDTPNLEEITWLKTQNSGLKFELDTLEQESLDLNKELLQLELQVATLQSETKPANVETRVVYNFVNVPIGAAIDPQSSDMQTIDPPLVAPSVTSSPINESLPDYSASEPAFNDDSFYEGQVGNGQYSPDSQNTYNYELITTQEYDESADLMREWEIERHNYPIDGEIIYDADTGFYINPLFDHESDEIEYTEIEGENMSYPPLAVE